MDQLNVFCYFCIFLTFLILLKICIQVNKAERVNLHPPSEVLLFHVGLASVKSLFWKMMNLKALGALTSFFFFFFFSSLASNGAI